MNKKIIISQSIMWAAAILVVSIVEEKEFGVLMLVILATTSILFLKSKFNEIEKINKVVDRFEKNRRKIWMKEKI